jgi:GntR family transcriptional regulator, rspAB operon transcriptional repressor
MDFMNYESISQHEKIIKIIEKKDVDQVDDLIQKHISEPIKLWESLQYESSPYFDYFDLNYSKMPAILRK